MGKRKNRYTSKKLDVAGITVYDSNSKFRRDFIKHHLKHSVDIVRFSYELGKKSNKPVVGPIFKLAATLHYKYMHTNSVVLPIEVAEEVIRNTKDIAVSPCVCRVVRENCDHPLYTCFGINYYGEFKKKQGERSVTQEEALAIARNAHDTGLIASLESCVQPYQNNLCFCCTCCCSPMSLRYEYDVPVYNNGPYLPHYDETNCEKCRKCQDACPVQALKVDDDGTHNIDLTKCMGCGLCESACPNNFGHMEKHEERTYKKKEPSSFRVFMSIMYVYLVLMPMVLIFKKSNGSMQERINMPPREKDLIDKTDDEKSSINN